MLIIVTVGPHLASELERIRYPILDPILGAQSDRSGPGNFVIGELSGTCFAKPLTDRY